jgi:hypothetical protein
MFPSKKMSNDFKSSISTGAWFHEFTMKEPPEASRYSVVFDPRRRIRSILLNASALETDLVDFVLNVVLARAYDDTPMREFTGSRRVGKAVFSLLKSYNAKLGIPFVSFTTHTKEHYTIVVTNLNQSYTTFQVLREIVSEDNLDEASEFVEKHIELILAGVDWGVIHLLDESLDLLWKLIEVVTVIAGVSGITALRTRMEVLLSRQLQGLREKLHLHPDLANALAHLVASLAGAEIYSTRISYIEASCKAFSESATTLGPHLDRMDETIDLARAAKAFHDGLENGRTIVHPQFGTLERFTELLSEIFEKRNVYPEVPIRAGELLFNLLSTMMLARYDYTAYLRALEVGRKLSKLIAQNYNEVKQKNPESFVKREDIATPLLMLQAAALTYNDLPEVSRLEEEARAIVRRHNLLHVKNQLDWTRFLVTQNFDYLLEIYRDFQTAISEDVPGIDDHMRFLGHLASATFEKENRESHLNLARDYAADMRTFRPPHADVPKKIAPELLDPFPGPISDFLAQNSGDISLYCAELFAALLDIESSGISEERVKKLKLVANILESVFSPIHPGHRLVLRTKCLCALLQRDSANLSIYLDELQKRAGSEDRIANFARICNLWTAGERMKLKLVKSLESDIDTRDPWNRIALQFVNSDLSSQLKEIDIFDYDALVIVEGSSDKKIFEKLALHIRPNLNLLFIEGEGWTSHAYFAESKTALEAKRQVVVIFDGDTEDSRRRDIKNRLLTQLKSNPIIVTLIRNSIEDYILVPSAIKAAIPTIFLNEKEITSYLEGNAGKRNKKAVLDHLLKSHAGIKYDGAIGANIASHMSIGEIDPEIVEIFASLRVIPGSFGRVPDTAVSPQEA